MARQEEKIFNKPMKVLLLIVIALGVAIAIMFIFNERDDVDIVDTMIGEDGEEIKISSDGTKYLVDPAKVRGGGPPKGGIGVDKGIPALAEENIKFVSVSEADEWIEDNELVLVLVYKGIERVYPLQILTFHEIVNDVVAGDSILITYCPLCGSGIAYEPIIEVNGVEKVSRFGTSGKLYNSNLIMYDEETDTYWQQIDGKAIIGDLVGQELKEISIDTVVWKDWKDLHPNSEVLSQDTGIARNYGRDPYGGYFEDDFLFYQTPQNVDDTNRIKNKEFVFGVEIDGEYKAYREIDVKDKGEIKDTINGIDITITRQEDGIVKVIRDDNGEEIVKEVDFWFAWYAFHPETELYGF
jgi:hypothetical protein